MTEPAHFPFSAIVGQEDMKDALLCNAVHPGVGGVLISGTRGTAKSTAARSLAGLLPEMRAVADCPFHCPPDEPDGQCVRCSGRGFGERPELVEEIPTPFVNLPIGATEDRVLGTIDLESAIQEGERSFEPGLLARANRGILYVDEVNLLGDHLVDVLLDAVATGTNRVEREGISVEHPADVMLVGTMNPEEGELRPQLLDRFGLYVEMDREMAPEERKAVVRRRTAYDDDPQGMVDEWREAEAALADRVEGARKRFDGVRVGDEELDRIVDICVEHGVDGLRADIVIHRTARALAALDGERAVRKGHVVRAAELALGHRSGSRSSPGSRRPDPGDDGGPGPTPGGDSPDRPPSEELPAVDPRDWESGTDGASGDEPGAGGNESERRGATEDRVFPVTDGWEPPRPEPDRGVRLLEPGGHGGQREAATDGRRGAYYRSRRPRSRPSDLALDATVRAAAPHQITRQGPSGLAVQLEPSDLREKQRRAPVRTLAVFVVDSSGSMGAYEQMSAVKGAVLSLFEDAYQRRGLVSIVGFREDRAETLLPPTSSMRRAARELAEMPTGGRTPLAEGLDQGLRVVTQARRSRPDLAPVIVVVTDGRTNYAESADSPVRDALERACRIRNADVSAVCFDTETGPVRLGIPRRLAARMGAEYYRFHEFGPGELSATVREVLRVDGPPRS